MSTLAAGGHVTRELARRVGPGGSVVGIDLDQELLELAAADLAAASTANVELRCDEASHLEAGAYDLAYARLLLSHVSDPAGVITAMVNAGAPGGAVAVEDLDILGFSCCPPSAAHDRWVEIYGETVRRRGGDAYLGTRLPAMLQAAGVNEVQVAVSQPCSLDGEAKLVLPMALAAMTEFIVGESVATTDEIVDIVAELYCLAADPTVLMGMPRIVHAWGAV